MIEVAIQSLLAVLPPEERARMGWPDEDREALAAACGAAAATEDIKDRAACAAAEPALDTKN